MNRSSFFLLISLGLAVAGGCARPFQARVIRDGRPLDVPRFDTPRACTVRLGSVTDRRGEEEIQGFGQKHLTVLVPLVLFNFIGSAGPVYANPRLLEEDLVGNLGVLLTDVLDGSGLASGTGPVYTLDVEIRHYYGVRYNDFFIFFSPLGGFASQEDDFLPTGAVKFRLTLKDEAGRVVAVRQLGGNHLYRRDDANDTPQLAACRALAKVLVALPATIDEMISGVEDRGLYRDQSPHRFLLSRMTREHEFTQEILVDAASGAIVRNRLCRRRFPIIARPDEWVVVPVAEDGHWLHPDAYGRMVEHLRQRYDLHDGDNAQAVIFRGTLAADGEPERDRVSRWSQMAD